MISNEDIFRELQNLLTDLSIQIRYGSGYFDGGLCRYKDQKYLYLNKSQDIEQQITLMITEIKKLDLKGVSISPTITKLLSEYETN